MSKRICLSACLSVCPSVTNFDPNYLRTGRTEWGKKLIYDFLAGNNYPDSSHWQGGYEICNTNFTSTFCKVCLLVVALTKTFTLNEELKVKKLTKFVVGLSLVFQSFCHQTFSFVQWILNAYLFFKNLSVLLVCLFFV